MQGQTTTVRAESYFFWVLLETIVSHNATWNRLYYLLFDSGFMYKRQSRRFRAISHFSRESGLRTLRSLLWIHRNLFNMFLVSPVLGTLLILLVLYFHADEKFHEYAIRPFYSYSLFSQSDTSGLAHRCVGVLWRSWKSLRVQVGKVSFPGAVS